MTTFKKLVCDFTVKSFASGNMVVEIGYYKGIPPARSRIAIAEEISAVLRRAAKAKKERAGK